MAYEPQKVRLPATELGEDRCFQIGYFGQGDIFAATWEGDLDTVPRVGDGMSTRFNLSHGADPVLVACHIGYLRRLGHSEQDIKDAFLNAGADVLRDDLGVSYGSKLRLNTEVSGSGFPRFDVLDQGLQCLMMPRPSQPGVLDEVGGTGIYMRPNEHGEDLLVWAQLLPNRTVEDDETRIGESASFCSKDVPIIVSMICAMSLGDYRRDIQNLLQEQFLNG